MKKIRLLIVDDHTLVRDGLVSMLSLENDLEIVGLASKGSEALEKIKEIEVDVVLMDIIMEGINGLETTRLIKEFKSNVEVILLSMEVNEMFIAEGIRYGAKSYLPKDISRGKLLEAIRTVASGDKYFDSKVSQIVFESFYHKSTGESNSCNPVDKLSKREIQVMTRLADGLSSQEIARKLGISVKTVDAHRYNILQKLRLKNNVELIRYAIKNGLVVI